MRRDREDADQTRNAILNAALQVFTERGIAGATLERISRTAGLTRGAFYWHFKDKSDLLQALIKRSAFPQRDLIIAAAEAGHDDPIGLLAAAASEVLIQFEADERRQQLFRIMATSDPASEAAASFRQADIDMFHVLTRLTTLAHEQGTLTADFTPEEAAGAMMISMNGLLSEWLRSDKAFSLSGFGRRIIQMHLRLLQKHPDG